MLDHINIGIYSIQAIGGSIIAILLLLAYLLEIDMKTALIAISVVFWSIPIILLIYTSIKWFRTTTEEKKVE